MKYLFRLCLALTAATLLLTAFSHTSVLSSAARGPRAPLGGELPAARAAARATAAALPPPIVVNSTADVTADDGLCTLREALGAVLNGVASGSKPGECVPSPTINFSVTGTINLSGALPNLSTGMTIAGPGAGLLTVRRDTGGSYRILTVNQGATVQISGLTLTNGEVPLSEDGFGGGGLMNAGTLSLTGVLVSSNHAAGVDAGGIYNSGTLSLTDCTVADNVGGVTLLNPVGGIENHGTLFVTRSTLSGNRSSAYGALNNLGPATLVNSTVSGNIGSYAIGNESAMSLTNCTVALTSFDSQPTRGIVSLDQGSSTTVANSIIALNGADVVGVFHSLGHNLIGNAQGSPEGSTGFTAPGDQVGTDAARLDPRLAPLADNGGPTRTHALLAGSPALDAGDNSLAVDANGHALTTDQRGLPRLADAADADTTQTVDIGAFEAGISVEDIPDKATDEDTPLSFTFNVGDSALGISSVTATSSNTSLVPNDAGHVSVTGAGSTRTLQLIPLDNLSGVTVVTVTATDAAGHSMSDTFNLTVNAVNDPPVNAVPGPQTTVENTPLVFSAANSNAISVSDVDAGTDPFKVTLTATHGTLTLGSTAGITFITGDGTDDATISFTGTLLNVNSSLNGLTFKPDKDFAGQAGLQVVSDDQGHNGAGGAKTDTDSVVINVLPGGTLQLGGSAFEAGEAAGTATFKVTRAGGSAGATSVKFATSPGTATGGSSCAPGVDFVNHSGTLNWADGDAADKSFTVTICDDSAHEPDETVVLSLSGVTGSAGLGTPSSATLTIKDDDPAGGRIEFAQDVYTVPERGGSVSVKVRRTGDTTRPAAVDYATDDGSTPSVAVPCSAVTGIALERCDYTRAAGTLQFAANETEKSFVVPITDDSYAEGTETAALKLSNPSGAAVLGPRATATLQITDDVPESAGNPIDDDQKFVIQHYHDFLNREPDASGLQFWTQGITSCGSDSQCREVKRVNTSAAFFLSIEFQQTGFLVERMYKAAYGDTTGVSTFPAPHTLAVPVVRLGEFLRDTQEIGQGVVVGQGNWQQQLDANKNAYAQELVARQRFTDAFPSSLTADQFVRQLNTNAGGVLSEGDRAQLDNLFGGPNASSNDAAKRAQALRQVAENPALAAAERNRAFVLMQFFGYLRRNPDDAQDTDYTGYDFWLTKLNQFNGNFVQAEMVKAFITSIEYRQRFGQ